MRKTLGVLLTIGGAGLVLLAKKRLRRATVVERRLTLTTRNNRCEILEAAVQTVELRWPSNDEVHWIITNPASGGAACGREVRVCMQNWRWNHLPTPAPVGASGGGPLCKKVGPGESETIRARVRLLTLPGSHKYDVVVDDDFVLDPMVEIVP